MKFKTSSFLIGFSIPIAIGLMYASFVKHPVPGKPGVTYSGREIDIPAMEYLEPKFKDGIVKDINPGRKHPESQAPSINN